MNEMNVSSFKCLHLRDKKPQLFTQSSHMSKKGVTVGAHSFSNEAAAVPETLRAIMVSSRGLCRANFATQIV